jgi:hypothetical protein
MEVYEITLLSLWARLSKHIPACNEYTGNNSTTADCSVVMWSMLYQMLNM